MATQLPSPITVTQAPYSATATHEQFGGTFQKWRKDAPLNIYLVAGTEDASGVFTPINGTRSDNSRPSPDHAHSTKDEYDAWVAQTETQGAVAKLAELHKYITADRDPALKPAWLP